MTDNELNAWLLKQVESGQAESHAAIRALIDKLAESNQRHDELYAIYQKSFKSFLASTVWLYIYTIGAFAVLVIFK